jgi:biotin operon repressor
MNREALKSSNYVMCFIPFIKKFGANTAIVLGRLINAEEHYGEEFYVQQARIAADTGLSDTTVKRAITELKDSGCLAIERRGMPAKNYYRLTEKIDEICENYNEKSCPNKRGQIDLTREVKLTQQERSKRPNKYNNKQNNNKEIHNATHCVGENGISAAPVKDNSGKIKISAKTWKSAIRAKGLSRGIEKALLPFRETRPTAMNQKQADMILSEVVNQVEQCGELETIESINQAVAGGWTTLYTKRELRKSKTKIDTQIYNCDGGRGSRFQIDD